VLGGRALRETEERRTQRTPEAERGCGLCGAHGYGKRRTGAGRDDDGERAARLTSAIDIPRRAADQRRISVRRKAATPERSRTAPARAMTRKGSGPKGLGDRSRSAQWGLVATPAPIFVSGTIASRAVSAVRPSSPATPELACPGAGRRSGVHREAEQASNLHSCAWQSVDVGTSPSGRFRFSSCPRWQGQKSVVIPAEAGIHSHRRCVSSERPSIWIPAYAGMTDQGEPMRISQ